MSEERQVTHIQPESGAPSYCGRKATSGSWVYPNRYWHNPELVRARRTTRFCAKCRRAAKLPR